MTPRYLDIEMPASFVLEVLTDTGDWIDYGWFGPEVFERNGDGTYVCSGTGSSSLFLRCLRQDGVVLYVVDGEGQPFTYRMVDVGPAGVHA